MRLNEVIWKEQFVVKLEEKHHVFTDEVEDVLFDKPFVRRIEKGRIQDEDLYAAYGQTTETSERMNWQAPSCLIICGVIHIFENPK